MKDTLKLPNVLRHILANPEILKDPMYRVQEVEQWRAAYYENQKAKHLGSNS